MFNYVGLRPTLEIIVRRRSQLTKELKHAKVQHL